MDRQCSSPVDEAVSRHNVTAQHQAMGNTLQTPDRKTNRHELLSAQTSIVSQDSSGESTNSANHSPSNSGGQTSEIKFGNWDKKFLLTLDGGGVRGFSTLLIIQELMKLCKRIEQREPDVDSSYHPLRFQQTETSGLNKTRPSQFLPVHYFDYIAGTSTGGLIAIMLSRLRMSIDDCIEEYSQMGEHIFGSPRKFSMRGPFFVPWKRAKYDHRKLEAAIKDVVQRRRPRDQVGDAAFPSASGRCRTIVVAVKENNYSTQPYLFRTYEHTPTPSPVKNALELNPGLADQLPIWQVARATTAAPTYFKPLTIGKEKFLDGGWGMANNPTWHAYQEVCQMEGKKSEAIELTVSIGTGKADKVRPVARSGTGVLAEFTAIVKYSAAAATDSERIHLIMQGHPTTTEDNYQRFSVDGGLGDVDLGEWTVRGGKNMTLEKIASQTRAYLDQEDTRRRLQRVATILVKNRQERSKDPQWAIVATGHRYRCSVDGCHGVIFTREEDLRSHLLDEHLWPTKTQYERSKLAKAIDRGRILHAD